MPFPYERMRRLRSCEGVRRMVRETSLSPEDFVLPLFVVPGKGRREPVQSMPGVWRTSPEIALELAQEAHELGVPAVLLFGVPDHKDEQASAALDPDGVVPRTIAVLRRRLSELVVIADVCLCAYTDHGHCGVVRDGVVENDETLELLEEMALNFADAGADVIAPSDMMDGRVAAIRDALDEEGMDDVLVMSYSAKYASAFYGPFREAACSAPSFGDRRTYQMDPPNLREAMREIELDIEEGADIVMVKPALAYLDVVRAARQRFDHPIAAYSVSGEYAMVKAAAAAGWLDERACALELLTGIKRAGADIIITYWATEAARWLREG